MSVAVAAACDRLASELVPAVAALLILRERSQGIWRLVGEPQPEVRVRVQAARERGLLTLSPFIA